MTTGGLLIVTTELTTRPISATTIRLLRWRLTRLWHRPTGTTSLAQLALISLTTRLVNGAAAQTGLAGCVQTIHPVAILSRLGLCASTTHHTTATGARPSRCVRAHTMLVQRPRTATSCHVRLGATWRTAALHSRWSLHCHLCHQRHHLHRHPLLQVHLCRCIPHQHLGWRAWCGL